MKRMRRICCSTCWFMRSTYVRADRLCSEARALEARRPAAACTHIVFAAVFRNTELAAQQTCSGTTMTAHQYEKQMHNAHCHIGCAGGSCSWWHLHVLLQPFSSNSSLTLRRGVACFLSWLTGTTGLRQAAAITGVTAKPA